MHQHARLPPKCFAAIRKIVQQHVENVGAIGTACGAGGKFRRGPRAWVAAAHARARVARTMPIGSTRSLAICNEEPLGS
jgi:hypothetical protein